MTGAVMRQHYVTASSHITEDGCWSGEQMR